MLAGKYRVERVIGQGGMGVVVAAYHMHLDERVAIKFLLPEVLDNPDAVRRFSREARAAVKIKSEHVARVIDVGSLESGAPYMVMEYLEGEELKQTLGHSGPLSFEAAADYVLQASEALAEAHARGIIHRDLKPANLFLTRRADGSACVKILDFGISKLTGPFTTDSDLGITKTSVGIGSPVYMSPEQTASAKDVDTRTDIWALGVILYELVTGHVPFMADNVPALCAAILQSEPAPLRNHRPDAPPGFVQVIERCLCKDPKDRFPGVAELALALLPFATEQGRLSARRISKVALAAGLTMTALPPSSDARPDSGIDTTQDAWSESSPSLAPKTRKRMIALGGLVAAVLLIGFLISLREPDEPAAAAPSSAVPASTLPVSAPPASRPAPVKPSAPVITPVEVAPAASVEPDIETSTSEAEISAKRNGSAKSTGKPKAKSVPKVVKSSAPTAKPTKPRKPVKVEEIELEESVEDLYGSRK